MPSRRNKSKPKHRVVIVGANFAGLSAAMGLTTEYDVTVVDRWPYFEFFPNIHELVSGIKRSKHLRLLRKRLLQRCGHEFVQDEVTRIDPVKNVVYTASGRNIIFEICVVAVGGINNTFGIPGVDRFSMPFKSVADCNAIGHRLKKIMNTSQKISIVIVGGGLEGVESLGEILRRYKKTPGLTIHMVEARDRLLPTEPESISREVQSVCQPYPVQFHLQKPVAAVTAKSVKLETGETLPSDLTIWTGGVAPPALLAKSGLAESSGSWAPIHPTLQSIYFENVFVVGDAAGTGEPLSKQSYHAINMGELVVQNIKNVFKGEPMSAFKPDDRPNLITFGDLDAYLVLGKRVIAGTPLSVIKEAIFEYNMARFDPPNSLNAIERFQDRSFSAILKLAIPTLTSPLSLARLADVRLLSDYRLSS
jgi:NADH dehydrogenase